MTVAAQTQKIPKNASFEIKSSQLSMLVFRLRSFDLQLVASEMEKQFADSPDFFDGEPVLIDMNELVEEIDHSSRSDASTGADIDLDLLIGLLSRYRLKVVGVRGIPSSLRDSVCATGLFIDDGLGDPASPAPKVVEQLAETVIATSEAEKIDIDRSAMVIDKPLRSGQQVYARGRDLVVLSMVNPGAEVIADGHIHVYAPLRGKAMAGAAGDIRARVFAASFEPELLSIAGIWQTSEALQKDPAWGTGAQVRLVLDEEQPATSDSVKTDSASSYSSAPTSTNRARLVISRLGK